MASTFWGVCVCVLLVGRCMRGGRRGFDGRSLLEGTGCRNGCLFGLCVCVFVGLALSPVVAVGSIVGAFWREVIFEIAPTSRGVCVE